MAQVSIICKRTVVSTKPVEPGKFSPLSVLDRIMEQHHLRLVFYYNLPTRRSPGEATRQLRESISEMLSSYPPVVGRLVRTAEGQWSVKCNDAGVRMVEARVDATVEEWLRDVDREKELTLIHWEEMSHKPYFWSTFYVQITEFKCGGLAIGLSCTHMLSDPTSATMLIKAWADATLKGHVTSPPLFHPLPSTQPTNPNPNSISHYKSAMQTLNPPQNPPKHTTIAFHFNQQTLANCIASSGPHLSPFQALAALFWTSISKIKGKESGLIEMSVCFDARKALGLEGGFFGSCMMYRRVHRVGEAAALIGGMDGGDGALGLVGWLEGERWERGPAMNDGVLVCVDLGEVDMYSAVYEEGAPPLRAACYVEPAGGVGEVVVMPAPDGDGRVVAVTLPEDEGGKLLDDALIRRFGPTIIMGLKKKVTSEK